MRVPNLQVQILLPKVDLKQDLDFQMWLNQLECMSQGDHVLKTLAQICLKFLKEDDRTLTLKEILLEMSQLPDILPSSAADRRPIEHTFVSINELPVVKDSEPKKPESVNLPVEEKTLSHLDDLFLNDQDDDASINLLDPLWSNIQQELKITESEEDLSTHSESTMDPKRTPSPLTATNLKVESNGVTDVLSSLQTDLISESVDADGVKKEAKSQKDSLIPSVTNKLESSSTLPQESQESTMQDQPVIDDQPSKLTSFPSSAKLVPDKPDKEDTTIEKRGKKECGKKLEISVDLEKVEHLEDKVDERKSSESLDNDDYDLEVESVHTFELEEFWEDHHWVTSPLHSPKLKNFFEKAPAIPPKRRGTTGELYKRPEFTRSLSLDSKDTRASQWTLKVAEMKADGGSYIRSRTDQIFNLNMQREPRHCQTVNAESEVPDLEKKDVVSEPDQRPKQPLPPLTGHNDIPKILKTEVKPVEEKENNDPITVDNSHNSGLNSSTDINHSILQDAPVLRRKRTSDGEAAGDTPLSSKMERSSGLSRSSFRARSGRPQSLILFSPPFPIMDHPAIDSKILLSPIKSQTQTNQESTGVMKAIQKHSVLSDQSAHSDLTNTQKYKNEL
ncbi:unnamed protein product [Ranitomeya imitator]|uniref:Uncharacterized protein n=1 Tax=Ranitomeya imitator TaxID=111125 RepID=A0ABN9LHD9_9NEOB|nr:unnamed protein product [Ranitomeya imitator]